MTDSIIRCEYCNEPAVGYTPTRDLDWPSMLGIFLIPPLLEAVCQKCAKRIEDHWGEMNGKYG